MRILALVASQIAVPHLYPPCPVLKHSTGIRFAPSFVLPLDDRLAGNDVDALAAGQHEAHRVSNLAQGVTR